MATGYFGTVYPFKPSFVSEGEYTDVVATSTEGGTGKTLSIRVYSNGIPQKITLSNLAWSVAPQQSYSTTLSLPSSEVGYEGTNLKVSVSFIDNAGVPVSDTNNLLEADSIFINGKNYRAGETIAFDDGVVSGTAIIEQTNSPQFTVLQVSAEGIDYADEDTLIIPKSEFLRVQPTANYVGTSLGIPFFKQINTLEIDPGRVLVLEPKNQGFETPYEEGVYHGLTATGGSGTGLSIDLTVVGSGGILTRIGEKSGWGIPANTSEIKAPVPVALDGGSGAGASIYVGLRKVVQNSDNPSNPDYSYGFYTSGIASGGSGYLSADILTITRANLIAAGFSLNVLHEDENISVSGVSTPNITLDVRDSGSGYTNGETVSVSPSTLASAGVISGGGTTPLSFIVKTLNHFGYAGVPTRTYTNYGDSGVPEGRNSDWDALDGVYSERTTWTTGDQGRPLAPESSGAETIPTKEGKTTILIRGDAYVASLDGIGPFVQQESMPIPIYLNETAAQNTVDIYAAYLKRFALGDFYGTTIQEGVRIEVYENWTPHMPFRYVDPFNNKVSAMRMDATTWTVNAAGAVFSTNGIWVGDSNGDLSVDSNLQGTQNAPAPGFSDTTGLRYPAQNVSGTGGGGSGQTVARNVSIANETYVDFGDEIEMIAIYDGITIEVNMIIQPAGSLSYNYVEDVLVHDTTVVYKRGEVVTAGDTIDATNSGGIPAAQGDTLLTDGFTYVIEDLFATT